MLAEIIHKARAEPKSVVEEKGSLDLAHCS